MSDINSFKVAIIGMGHVGTPLAIECVQKSIDVVGIEANEDRVRTLKEISRIRISSDFSNLTDRNIAVIAVPTPIDSDGNPDLTAMTSVLGKIKDHLPQGSLVINESTSFPGTLRNLIAAKLGSSYSYATSPERIDPGNNSWTIGNTPRLVAGLDDESLIRALDFYKIFCTAVEPVTSPEVAELAKLIENSFRQINIAFVNELSKLAEKMNISIFHCIDAAATKPFGFMPFYPSLGVGGHCIPVDPSYLSFFASELGVDMEFIKMANKVNRSMPIFVAERLDREFGLKGRTVQIAGISYKSNVADTRESPALELIRILKNKGAEVSWHDEIVGSFGGETSSQMFAVEIGIICTAHDDVDYSPWKHGTRVIDVSTAKDLGWPKFL